MSEGAFGAAIRAAAYVRMSTDHQKYSTVNQLAVIEGYAAGRGMVIVRIYADEGKSGLDIDHRDGLQKLINDVNAGQADFELILVYDVSRWGRFQDIDESAYYEFMCRRAGIQVHYCAEQFENDGSPLAAIVKGIKRAMAGEFSRELSAKSFLGQTRLVKLGYSAGASAPYGLRRLLVDERGTPKGLLARGQQKNLQNDRVIIVPGPAAEIEVVRWIFDAFAKQKMREREIARALNRRGIRNVVGKHWTSQCVRRVLKNERYIGNNVWNRTSGKLKTKRSGNRPDQWVRADGAFKAVIDRAIFDEAQALIRVGNRPRTFDEKLEPLRRLLREHGYLSAKLIDRAPGVPRTMAYHRWFGGLYPAYALVGYVPSRLLPKPTRPARSTTRRLSNERMLEALRQLLLARGLLTEDIIDEAEDLPCAATYKKRFGGLKHAYELIGYNNRLARRRRDGFMIDGIRKLSNDELLDKLKKLLERQGYLTRRVIDHASEVPSASTYRYRFGGLEQAYTLIGYEVGQNTPYSLRKDRQNYSNEYLLEVLKQLKEKHGSLSRRIIEQSKGIPSVHTFVARFGSLAHVYELIGYRPENAWGKAPLPADLPQRPRSPKAPSDAQMLKALRTLWREQGRLSQTIIDKSRRVPSCTLYRTRFGSITRVYELIGYQPDWRAHRPKAQA